MKSSWQTTKNRSLYHFDNSIVDPRWDTVQQLGQIECSWSQQLLEAIDQSHAVTWRTRGRDSDPLSRSAEEYDQEEYDLEQQGYGRNHVVSNLTYNLAPVFEDLVRQFALDQTMARIHVQHPGQVWNLHLDKLEKWMPTNPQLVVRYFVQLTDWQQGHFWSYGNFVYQGWKAGDVTTFDWLNVPHATANAGHVARATLQITGIKTAHTEIFLNSLKSRTESRVDT